MPERWTAGTALRSPRRPSVTGAATLARFRSMSAAAVGDQRNRRRPRRTTSATSISPVPTSAAVRGSGTIATGITAPRPTPSSRRHGGRDAAGEREVARRIDRQQALAVVERERRSVHDQRGGSGRIGVGERGDRRAGGTAVEAEEREVAGHAGIAEARHTPAPLHRRRVARERDAGELRAEAERERGGGGVPSEGEGHRARGTGAERPAAVEGVAGRTGREVAGEGEVELLAAAAAQVAQAEGLAGGEIGGARRPDGLRREGRAKGHEREDERGESVTAGHRIVSGEGRRVRTDASRHRTRPVGVPD